MTLLDVFMTAAVAVVVWIPLSLRLRTLGRVESQVVVASFGAHLVASVATIAIAEAVYGGVVDFNGFRRAGALIAEEMRGDFFEVFPRAVLLFFHQDAWINVPLNLEPRGGRSTVSMWIVAAFGDLLLFRSFQATSAACALFSFGGKLAIFEAFREYFPERYRSWVAAAAMLVPSVVYWTSGLIKEAIAVGGLGFAIWGMAQIAKRVTPTGVGFALGGALVVAAIKPYLLIALALGTGAWIYSARSRGPDGKVRIRPVWFALTVAVALFGVIAVGRLFPQFSVERLGEEAARMQFYGRRAAGGSYYELGDPTETSLVGQLQYAPIALFTALFRPLVFEARDPQVLVNSFETTSIFGLTVWLLVRKGWRWMFSNVISNPALSFAVAFSLPLALGVGLISNNLGTLSRYRCPLVPFLVLALLMLTLARGDELVTRAGRVTRRRQRPVEVGPAVPSIR
ncbi:MAG: hypothetical protein ABMA64_01300 [Myxococcota bacterium]